MSKKRNVLWVPALLAVGAVVASLMQPQDWNAGHRFSRSSTCKVNLVNIAAALEMYSTDWHCHYPTSLGALVPKYIKAIPECPVSGPGSYHMITGPGVGYNRERVLKDGSSTQPFQDYYLMWCEGNQHHRATDIPINYPQYDGISGLIER